MNEERAAVKFLTATLKAAPAVAALVGARVYESAAPQNPTYPFLILHLQTGADRKAGGTSDRMLSRGLWLLKAVTQGSAESGYAAADALYDAADAAVVAATGTVTVGAQEYLVQQIHRESPFRGMDPLQSIRYCHVGGLYRVLVHAVE